MSNQRILVRGSDDVSVLSSINMSTGEVPHLANLFAGLSGVEFGVEETSSFVPIHGTCLELPREPLDLSVEYRVVYPEDYGRVSKDKKPSNVVCSCSAINLNTVVAWVFLGTLSGVLGEVILYFLKETRQRGELGSCRSISTMISNIFEILLKKLEISMSENQVFFENIHLSPLKIHVSLTLSDKKSTDDLFSQYPFVGGLLQTLNIVEVQDVVKRAATHEQTIQRIRYPRYISPEGAVRPYIHHEAMGLYILNRLGEGKYAKTDSYIAHITCSKDPSCWLMATSHRIICIEEPSVFDKYEVQWKINHSDLQGAPSIQSDACVIQILTKSTSKHSQSVGKSVEYLDLNDARYLIEKLTTAKHSLGLNEI